MKKVFVFIMFAAVMSCQNAPEKDKYLNANDPLGLPYLLSSLTPAPPPPPPAPVILSNPGNGKGGLATVVFNNKILVIGGSDSQYSVYSTSPAEVWSSPDGATWTLETRNPGWTARFGHTCIVDANNRIWLMGGKGSSSLYNDIWYSDDGIKWTKWPALASWVGRTFHASVLFNGKIWVMGGNCSSSSYLESNEVWSMDTVTCAWTLEASNPAWTAREGLSCVVFNNKMWIMGGKNVVVSGGGGTSTTYYHDVWSSTDGKTWTPVTTSAAWSTRRTHTSVADANRMYIMGGENSYLPFNDVWYSTDGNTWTSTPAYASWSGRFLHSSLMFNNSIWVIGGFYYNSGTKAANEVWSSTGEAATLSWYPRATNTTNLTY